MGREGGRGENDRVTVGRLDCLSLDWSRGRRRRDCGVSDGGGGQREILTEKPGHQMEGERQRFETKNKDLD